MLNVLLISPLDPNIPSQYKLLVGGENTYTRTLLAYPPQGVRFTHYQTALKTGEVEHTYWQESLSALLKLRLLPFDAGYQCIRLNKHFDLIHCHSYSLKIDGEIVPPVILGSSSSSFLFLRDYLGWSEGRIHFQYNWRKMLHQRLHIYDPELWLYNAKQLITFSHFAKKVHAKLDQPVSKISIIYPGLAQHKTAQNKHVQTVTILFAGVWFARKGGYVLLAAFRELKRKYPHLKLIILGELPKDVRLTDASIEHHIFVPYDRLHNEFYARADILVHVPPKAEGYGMVVPEALSYGISVVVSNVYALPELVNYGQAGVVIAPGDVFALIHVLDELISKPKKRHALAAAAKKYFLEKFSLSVSNKELLRQYKVALKA